MLYLVHVDKSITYLKFKIQKGKETHKMKKLSKKEIYAAHGIEYKNGKILAPEFGYIRPLLVNGNQKIGKGAFHFSTLPTTRFYKVEINNNIYFVRGTCKCTCMENGKISCYATKGNYNFKSVVRSLAIKTILCYMSLDFVERAIMAQIEADNIQLCRIHAAGDFFNLKYAAMWRRIAERFQGVTFWTYTKNREAESAFDGLEHANIVKSFLPNGKMNFGHCDHIIAMYNVLKNSGKKVHICFCGIEKYAGIAPRHCTDCHGCAENDYVLFIEHSTDSQAEKDPLFPALVKLILDQDDNGISKAA